MVAGVCQEFNKLFDDYLGADLLSGELKGELIFSLVAAITRRTTDLSRENEELRLANEELKREVTRQQLLQEELRENAIHYQRLTEHATDVIWRLDGDYRFTYISPSDERLRGYRSDEVLGQLCLEIFDEEGAALVRKLGMERFETERRGERLGTMAFEARHRCKDGSWIWAEVSSTPVFDDEGKITGFYGITREFTQRKQAEILLQQAKLAAEEASKAKSEFLALVSHEIRTPLNSLVGFSSMARRTTDPLKLDQYHLILEQSSRSLMDLVNDILDMSKIEAGRMEFEVVPFNLRQLIDTLDAHYRHLAAHKKLELRIIIDESVPTWVQGDSVRLRQIFANLLGNAVKFTEKGEISCAVTLSGRDDGASPRLVSLEVRDSGIGIPEEKQSRLFQPFQQLDPSISRRYGGSGLGLAIVQSLVVMMGGTISVDSREGEGSRFTVQLPLPACEPPPEELLPHQVQLSLGNILVVEDNRFNRLLLEDLLLGWGQEVTLAEDGGEGLRLVDEQRFDLILLDIRMPGIDGIEVARRIRRREQERRESPVPIIALTADLEPATRDTCLQVGINVVLGKPIIPDQLARAMAAHCGRGGEVPPYPNSQLNAQVISGLGSDPERARRYRLLLDEDMDEELHSLRSALERGDREALGRAAHTLKGLCGQLTGRKPVELAAWLQENAPTVPLDRLGEVAGQLQSACRFTPIREGRW